MTLAERHGFALLAPEQVRLNNPNLCFNWFEPADARRGVGELASIHAMTEHAIASLALDASRVFVTGLSAGGAMTAALAAAYPETYAGAAVIAGLPFGIADNLHEALAAMRGERVTDQDRLAAALRDAAPATAQKPRMTIWHGDADTTVSSRNAAALARQWSAFHGASVEPERTEENGRRTCSTWRDAGGDAVVELNILKGFPHGTPISTRGDDPLGEGAPFVVEAGVSSSHEICAFWGLLSQSRDIVADMGVETAPPREEAASPSMGEKIMDSISPHVSGEVSRVINRALVAAGLLRP